MKPILTCILIYKISNNINNKVYVGQTTQTLLKRFNGHKNKTSKCIKLKNAMNKYGHENFLIECMTICHTQETADYWENYFINLHDSRNRSKGYNLRDGGAHGKHSEESIKKMIDANKGKHLSPKTEFKKGHRLPEETIERYKGRHFSPATEFKKGQVSGENSPSAKITQQIADKIRIEYAEGFLTQAELGTKYNITKSSVSLIIRNKTWVNLGTQSVTLNENNLKS